MDDFAALRLQIAWGVDEALADAPVDRRRGAAVPPARRTAVADRPRATANLPTPLSGNGTDLARATACRTIAELQGAIAGFEGCALRDTATHTVFADGDPSAELIVVGDPPCAEDDRSGKAFGGATGAYFERMLSSIGLDRSRAFLVPLIPWRPPGGRPPSESELALCRPFLIRYIELAAAGLLVGLGPSATRCLLGRAPRRRAGFIEWGVPEIGRTLLLLPIASPEQLMQQPALRAATWADLRLLRRRIGAAR